MELCRLIADIEPKRREDVRVRIVARGDAEQFDMDVIQYIGRKFDVSWAHAKSRAEGWPTGPNGMACEILLTAPEWLHENGWDDANGILLIEPDCVPLQKDWLDQILAAWAVALVNDAWIMGSWRNSGGERGHINGNCVTVPTFGKLAHLKDCGRYLAWDCWHSPRTYNHWNISGLFRNDFQKSHAREADLRTPEIGTVPPVLVHGYKDGSSVAIARRWMNL